MARLSALIFVWSCSVASGLVFQTPTEDIGNAVGAIPIGPVPDSMPGEDMKEAAAVQVISWLLIAWRGCCLTSTFEVSCASGSSRAWQRPSARKEVQTG